MIRGVRGAITVQENKEEDIVLATEKLLNMMILKNRILAENVASVFISATDDLNEAFPAKAMRKLSGWTYVPVMCMREISVPGSLGKCIRIMIHLNTEEVQSQINHIYLDGAARLRPDLPAKLSEEQ